MPTIFHFMFDSWGSFAGFLESAQGNFYYEALLLLLLSIASLALHSRAKPNKLDWRVNLAVGSLMGLRLILAAIYGYYWYSNLSIPAAAAPIERSVHLMGILLLAWIWSRQGEENGARQAIMAIASAGVLAVSLYITLPWLDIPLGSSFNYTDLDYLWDAACVVALVSGAWAIYKGGQQAKQFGLMQIGILLAGQIAHLLLAEPYGNMPLATEAANLLALPLLLLLPVKEEKKEISAGTEAFFPTVVPTYEVPGTSQKEPPPPSPEAEDLAKQTCKDLDADVCAFAALDDAQSEVQIHAGYNALLETNIDLVTVQKGEVPRLAAALTSGQILRLSADQHLTDFDTLVRLLKLSFPGNVMVAPVPNPRDQRIWFVLLVRMEEPWQLSEEVTLEQSTEEVSAKLIQALGYLEEETSAPQEIETTGEPTDESVQKLEEENERYRQDVARLLAHIDELKSQQAPVNGQAAVQSAGLVQALQIENERLKSAISSLESSRGVVAPVNIQVEEAKEELRLALEQVSSLQTRLDEAQKASLEAGAPQAPGRKMAANQVEVIASIAQELRQPLSSILGYTDLLLGESVGILGALQRKFLERVRSSTERMNSLIGDLIRIAELDQAGYSAQRKPVDLSAVIDDAIGQLRTQLQEKRIALRVDLPSQLPELNTDRDALQQILYHLLQNADAATPEEGAITLRAVIDSQPEFGDFVLLQVSDSGGGIPDEDLPRVFSRVYRANNPVIKGVGDTGVGLTIAETLTQALGGRIWVESESGVGAMFSVLLPLQPVANKP